MGGMNLGYWPKELLPNLETSTGIDFGGGVYTPNNEASPPMGNGHFPQEGIGKACYFMEAQFIGEDQKPFTPGPDWPAHSAQNADDKYYQILGENPVSGVWDVAYGGPGRNIPLTEEEDLELEKELQSLNKPPIKTLKSFTGDLFDCIEMYKQPAFDHPALKNHKLQIRPSFQTKNNVTMDENFKSLLLDPGFNDTCPPGTVIIRRTRKEELIMAKELPKYFRNYDSKYHVLDSSGKNYFAIMQSSIYRLAPHRFHGFQSKLTTWALPNVGPDQASANQIWMYGDIDVPHESQNVIQTGWHVLPRLYNDTFTRFFTFFTIDGYKTGCMNLNCKGFIQVSATHGPGFAFTGTDLSTYKGKQAYFDFQILKDPKSGNWWLAMGGINLGYWPKELLPRFDKSSAVDLGGSVYTPNNKASPPMGNGHFPQEGIGRACYFMRAQFIGTDQKPFTPGLDWAYPAKNADDKYYQISGDPRYRGDWDIAYGGPGGLVPG
ncbi:protein neprosin-like [Curcuma longa]|uniref:protein neprosin-like n=1 Tax=Curcuma longa TaxID=136217 RepID=UPI003D9F49B2